MSPQSICKIPQSDDKNCRWKLAIHWNCT
jgi:hypothetical protein